MKKLNVFYLLAVLILFVPSQSHALLSKANFCYGTLGSTIASAAGAGSTFTFAPGTNAGACPTSSFKVVLFSASCSSPSSCSTREIMTVTRSSTTFTIVSRQDEGTTKPSSWAVGTKVYHDLTAATFDEAYNAATVLGPGSSTSGYIPQWNNTSGTLLKAGVQLDTDVSLTANSDTRIGSQKAIKTYVDQRIISQNYGVTIGASGTNVKYGVSPLNSLTSGAANSAMGYQPLYSDTAGSNNTAVGYQPLRTNSTGNGNTAIGDTALYANTSGSNNVGVGSSVLTLSNGSNNTALGSASANGNITGNFNTALGSYALNANNGSNNTAVGAYALSHATTSTGNVALGIGAGYYETGSNKLFIDNAQRSSEADGRAKALIYGVFDAAVANQRLTVNGQLTTQGHFQVTGTAPTITAASCGTGTPTVTGTDNNFTVTFGTGTPVLCGITFASTWAAAPRCVVSNVSDTPVLVGISSSVPTSTTQVTISTAASAAGKIFNVHCE